MAVRSKTTIFNAALLRTGNSAVTEGDGSPVWQALDANYDEIVRAAFEKGEYPFGKSRTTLTSRSAGTFGYDDAYSMPSDVIHVSRVFLNTYDTDDTGARWDVNAETNELLVDAGSQTVEIEYFKVGQEHTWSAAFTDGVMSKLRAVIKDVQEESSEAAQLDSDGDYLFLQAGVKAGKNRSQRRVWKKHGGRLVRAHRGR